MFKKLFFLPLAVIASVHAMDNAETNNPAPCAANKDSLTQLVKTATIVTIIARHDSNKIEKFEFPIQDQTTAGDVQSAAMYKINDKKSFLGDYHNDAILVTPNHKNMLMGHSLIKAEMTKYNTSTFDLVPEHWV